MRAMVLERAGSPLLLQNLPSPVPNDEQILLQVETCGVCRTDLHIFDGELPHPKLPLILGHQIVGTVIAIGKKVTRFKKEDRVGVPWLGKSCGKCSFCLSGRENLCDFPLFTGYTIDGGFAEMAVAYADYAFPLPNSYSETAIAPLLCGGLVGFRAYRMLPKKAKRIGFYGFGSSAHILTQIATHEKKEIYAFTRKNDNKGQAFAKECGAIWAGASDEKPPHLLEGAIIFAPIGALIPQALQVIQKGGVVITGGIHMSEIPSFPYEWLWEERSIRSVANLTREDAEIFLKLATKISIKTTIALYPLEDANAALVDLRLGKFKGSAVITVKKDL